MAKNTKEKSGFKTGVYAVFAALIIAVILVVLTIFAFTTRYTAFSPDKVAQAYTDTIVQTGDGYNAYKNTLVSKNMKYGDFIRAAYMAPYVNEYACDEKGEPLKDENGKKIPVEQAEFVGTGSDVEQKAIDEVYNTMYDYFVELIGKFGFDDYDAVFNNYFAKLVEVRHEVYGDDFMNTEYMFGAFESNVDTYGKSLTGTQRKFASDNKTITQEETVGKYQEMFGVETDVQADALVDGKKKTITEKQLVYKLTSTVTESNALSDEEVAAYKEAFKSRITPFIEAGKKKAANLGEDAANAMVSAYEKLDCTDSIDAVQYCKVEVTAQDGTVVAVNGVYVVEIGNSWYIDNTNVFTSGLYLAK